MKKKDIKFKSEKYFKDSQVAVLLEDIQSNFRVFGEGLSGLREEVTGVKTELERLSERVARIELGLIFIKEELISIRKTLTLKSDLARLEALEVKVNRLETELVKLKK